MSDDITRHRKRRGLPILTLRRIEKTIRFCVTVACDGICAKAWGGSSRPRMMLSDDEDDYALLADYELGIAPADPGTYEGGHAKPTEVHSAADVNKWCVRECERMRMSRPGDALPLVTHDFSRRLYNIPGRTSC